MSGPISAYLAADHDRLGALLASALNGADGVAIASYEEFRAGLLRHIGIEERLLFPLLRSGGSDAEREMVARLHLEHAALAGILVLTPTRDLLLQVAEILEPHNAREEHAGGMYEMAERLAGEGVGVLAAQARAMPAARVAPHFDTPLAVENVRVLVDKLK